MVDGGTDRQKDRQRIQMRGTDYGVEALLAIDSEGSAEKGTELGPKIQN